MHRTVVWSIRELAEEDSPATEEELELEAAVELRVQQNEIKNAQSTSVQTSS